MNDSTASIEDPRFVPAQNWFETLQQRINAAMEALEREFAGVGPDRTPGQFVIESWERTDASGAPGGGGRMAMLRGRLFEKMGVSQDGKVIGRFRATGVRPKCCERLKMSGIHLPADMFEGVTEVR